MCHRPAAFDGAVDLVLTVESGVAGWRLDRWLVGHVPDLARARFGAVVDFVDAHYRGYHWLAFNVADSAITAGVVLLALHLLLAGEAGR